MRAWTGWWRGALFILLGAGCGGATPLPPLVVGHVGNPSGPDGEPLARGLRLALQQLTAEGFSQALADHPLQIRHTDTQGQLDLYEAQATRLVRVEHAVALVGGSTPAEAARLERARVPVLTLLGLTPSGLSGLTFCLGTPPRRQGEILALYVAEELKRDRVLVLADEGREASTPFVEAFGAAWKREARPTVVRFGKEPVWEELARRVAKEAPQVLLFVGRARDLRSLHGAWSGRLPELVFAGDDGDFQGLEATQPLYLTTAFSAEEKSERVQEFVRKYRDAFKTEPDVSAALGYDGLRVLADALKRSYPEVGGEALRTALAATTEFAGVTGPLSINGTEVRRPVYVARLAAAGLTALKCYPPDKAP